MRILPTNTAVRIVVGPFLDVTDGVTPETSLTVTNCTCELFHEHDDGSAPTRSALTLSASGGNNDMVHITSDVGGYYDLELTAANVNFVGRGRLSIIDTDVHLPVFEELLVVAANVYAALMGTDLLDTNASQVGGTAQTGRDLGASVLVSVGTGAGQINVSGGKVPATVAAADVSGNPSVNVAAFSGDTTAADNAEAFFDGTGYAGTNNVIPTVTTVTNLTNAPTNGDLTAAMKASVNAEVDTALNTAIPGTPTADSINERIVAIDGFGAPPSAADVADAVWDEALAGHAGVGSAGEALAAAGSAGDPWLTAIPGAYGAGTAGKILGDNINATIGSRSSHSAADVWAVATRTLTSFGTLASDVWAVATRTLTAISDSSGVTTLLSRIVGTLASGTHTAQSGDAYARLGAPVGASISGDIAAVKAETAAIVADTGTDGVVVAAASKTGYSLTAMTGLGNQTADLTGSLSGSVGSVTGAVGSVTGNVGGNVAGSVASVTGAVGSVTGNVGGNVVGSVASVTGAVGSVTGAVGSVTAGVTVTTNNDKTDYALSTAGVAAVWAYVVEGTLTAVQAVRGILAVAVGKLSGAATTTVVIRDASDTTDRVTATVDADGNRSAVTLDLD